MAGNATRGTRTPYLLLRRQLLYPGELVSHRRKADGAGRFGMGGFEPPISCSQSKRLSR